jgi:hypothetical protein
LRAALGDGAWVREDRTGMGIAAKEARSPRRASGEGIIRPKPSGCADEYNVKVSGAASFAT